MKIIIKVIKGKTFTLEIDHQQTVEELKRMIADEDGIEMECQKLVYKGKGLTNSKTLEEIQLKDGSTVVVMKRKVD